MENESGSIPATGVSETDSFSSLGVEVISQTMLETQVVPETRTASDNPEQQPEPTKKRKEVESRAKCWEHFIKMKDEVGGPTMKRKYCGKTLCAN